MMESDETRTPTKTVFHNINNTFISSTSPVCFLCDKIVSTESDRKCFFSVSGRKLQSCLVLEDYCEVDIQKENFFDKFLCRNCHRRVISRCEERKLWKDRIFPSSQKRLSTNYGNNEVKRKLIFSPAANIEPKVQTFASSREENAESVTGQLHLIYSAKSGVRKINLGQDIIGIVSSLARGNLEATVNKIMNHSSLGYRITKHMMEIVQRELHDYSSKLHPSILRQTDPNSMKVFSWYQVEEEMKMRTPTFLKFIEASSVNAHNAQQLTTSSLSAACKLVSIFNTDMKAVRYINSIILKNGGMKKKGFKRFSRTNDCMSYDSTNTLLLKCGDDFDKKVLDWNTEILENNNVEKEYDNALSICRQNMDNPLLSEIQSNALQLQEFQIEEDYQYARNGFHPGFSISGDNVDIRAKPRHMTLDHQNHDHHMFQMNVYKNRISSYHLSASEHYNDVNTIQLSSFLPGVETNMNMIHEMKVLVGHIWAKYIPALSWIKDFIPDHISHEHQRDVLKKTEKVHLGVYLKNEAKTDDMIDLCKIMHKYVPCDGDIPVTRIAARGDQLTEEREKEAIQYMRNARTPSKRLEGLIPVLDDFHAQAMHLEVAWNILFKGNSSTDVGTLFHAKQALKARNVTNSPSDNYYASQDLFKSFTEAYIVTGGLHFLGLDEVGGSLEMWENLDDSERKHYVEDKLEGFLTEYAVANPVCIDEAGEVSLDKSICNHCGKQYKIRSSFVRHMRKKHQVAMENTNEVAGKPKDSKEDKIFNYTCTALKLCLLIKDFDDAVSHGDGGRIFELDKVFVMLYKLTHHTKYAHDTFEYLAQVLCLLPQRYAHSIMWNRSVNTVGKLDTNYPMDLDVEHDNKNFKDNFHTHHGDVKQSILDRVSRSVDTVCSVVQNFDKTTGLKKTSGKHKEKHTREDDVQLLVKDYMKAKLFHQIPGRQHKAFPTMDRDPIGNIDMCNLQTWMKKLLSKFSRKSYYQ